MKNKKGISSIVVTILLVLVSIIAVTFVSVFIYKFVSENTQASSADLEIYIDDAKGMPCYNTQTRELGFNIKRGAGNANLTGIKLIAFYQGKPSISLVNTASLNELESGDYSFLGLETMPQEIRIAPIVQIGNVEKTLDISDTSVVVASSTCTASTANLGSVVAGSGAVPTTQTQTPKKPSSNVSGLL